MKNILIENKHYKTLNVLMLGHQVCPPLHSFRYAFTDFYLIHYVIEGHGKFYKNGIRHEVSKGEIFIIKPNAVYRYIADEKNPWEYTWVAFNGEISQMIEELPDVLKVDGTIFSEMMEASKLNNTRTEFLTGKVYELLSVLFENSKIENNYVKMASDYIKVNYTHRLYVEEIAETINLNRRYLSRIFKSEKGVTIQEYIVRFKIKKACDLLARGFKVSETAQMVGYDDSFTFSKIFKKHTGLSPKQYAKKSAVQQNTVPPQKN